MEGPSEDARYAPPQSRVEDVVRPGDRLFVFSMDEAADKVRNYF